MKKLFILIGLSLVIFACNSDETTDSFDKRSRIYTNSKYAVSFRVPKTWAFDYGITKNNFFRAYQKDSSYSFTAIVTENNLFSKASIHTTYDELGNLNLTNLIINRYKQEDFNNIPYDIKVKKSYLQNVEAIRSEYKMLEYVGDSKFEISFLSYAYYRKNYQVTIVASAPTILINANLIDQDLIISFFQHLPLK